MPERYGRVTVPIYHVVGGRFIAHLGSGVLVSPLAGSYWVASVRHVLDDDRGVVLPCSVQLPSKILSGRSMTVEQDPVDVGVAPLTLANRDALVASGYSILPLSEETVQVRSPRSGECILSGYPTGTVEVDGDTLTCGVGSLHARTSFVPFTEPGRIAATFDGFENDETGQPIPTPDPHGLSGGAMWHIEGNAMKLAGIAAEWDPARKLIIGTTVRAIMHGMVWKLSQGTGV